MSMAGIVQENGQKDERIYAGKYPATNFSLSLGSNEESGGFPCRSFRAFSRETDYDTIQEGGLNDAVHIRRKPLSKAGSFQIERYVDARYTDPLPMGAAISEDVVLKLSRVQGQFSEADAVFTFGGCIVTGKSYSDMDAEKAGLLVETTTVIYERLDVKWKK